jgi:hypothetical protein
MEILSDIRFVALPRNSHAYQSAALRRLRELDSAAEQFGAFAHGYETNTGTRGYCDAAFAMIFHFEIERFS